MTQTYIATGIALAVLAYVWWRLAKSNTTQVEQDYVPDGKNWNHWDTSQTVVYIQPHKGTEI